jgi:hypothetical protein
MVIREGRMKAGRIRERKWKEIKQERMDKGKESNKERKE